jgi:hypothetical protein
MLRTFTRIPGLIALTSMTLVLGCADDTTDDTTVGDEIDGDGSSTGDGDGDTTVDESGSTADTTADVDTIDTTADTSTDVDTVDTTADTSTDVDTLDTTADTSTDVDTTVDDTTTTTETTDDGPFCSPGVTICFDVQSTQTCNMDGSDWEEPVPCDPDETCISGACVSECEAALANPSSVGCSFFAAKMDNFYNNAQDPSQHDSLIAGNISSDKVVSAQLYLVPINGGAEQPVGNAVMIQPQGTYTWTLTQPEVDSQTFLRVGGVYRLETSLPVVAYQHSPIGATYTNDASMLLPEHALTGNYVVSSFPALIGPYPSYLTVIGVENNSTVNVEVRQATAGGGGVPALAANANTNVMMNRYSMLNIVVATQTGGDISGSIITSDQPLHVMGATECANVPNGVTYYCDHVEEAMLPLEYWGEEYVAAHAPQRSGAEHYFWRVYAGEDDVTISAAPAQPGFPIVLDKGQFHQFQANPAPNHSFVLTADGPFMPVQYLEGQTGGGNTGDPSMIQSVPTEQYLDAYAFVTGTGYDVHYVQVIRPNGGADVYIDGNLVGGYYTVGNYQVADVSTSQGAHFANSAQPFGIIQVGYTEATSYGYPGGMKLEVINPQ